MNIACMTSIKLIFLVVECVQSIVVDAVNEVLQVSGEYMPEVKKKKKNMTKKHKINALETGYRIIL